MKTVTLIIYDDDGTSAAGSIRQIYRYAMHRIRSERRAGRDCPYMKCSNPRLNFWLTCCRMSVTYGFDI